MPGRTPIPGTPAIMVRGAALPRARSAARFPIDGPRLLGVWAVCAGMSRLPTYRSLRRLPSDPATRPLPSAGKTRTSSVPCFGGLQVEPYLSCNPASATAAWHSPARRKLRRRGRICRVDILCSMPGSEPGFDCSSARERRHAGLKRQREPAWRWEEVLRPNTRLPITRGTALAIVLRPACCPWVARYARGYVAAAPSASPPRVPEPMRKIFRAAASSTADFLYRTLSAASERR